MKPTLLSVKELAQELGISADLVYRAYRKKEIPAAQINRMIRFNLEKVQRTMEQKAEGMPNKSVVKAARDRRPGPAARPAKEPPDGKTGASIAEEQ